MERPSDKKNDPRQRQGLMELMLRRQREAAGEPPLETEEAEDEGDDWY